MSVQTIEAAKLFAEYCHRNQFRADKITPYFTHLSRVASLTSRYVDIRFPLGQTIVAGAYLHDVMEDCEVSKALIATLFGNTAAEIVARLTNIPIKKNETHKEATARKSADNDRIVESGAPVVLIKLCDRYDNLNDLSGMGEKQIANFHKKTIDLLTKLAPKVNGLTSTEKFWYIDSGSIAKLFNEISVMVNANISV